MFSGEFVVFEEKSPWKFQALLFQAEAFVCYPGGVVVIVFALPDERTALEAEL